MAVSRHAPRLSRSPMNSKLLNDSDLKLHFGGRFVQSTSGQRLQIRSPATRELIATVPDASLADVTAAADAAAAAYGDWSSTDPNERARCLRRLADIIRER